MDSAATVEWHIKIKGKYELGEKPPILEPKLRLYLVTMILKSISKMSDIIVVVYDVSVVADRQVCIPISYRATARIVPMLN